MKKIKQIIKVLFCKHKYIWIENFIDEYNHKLIIDEYYCEKCKKTKQKYTWVNEDLINDDL